MQKETEIKLRVSRETLSALREHPLLKKRNKSGWERRELFNQYFDTPARDLAEAAKWLALASKNRNTAAEVEYAVMLFNGEPIAVTPPNFVVLRITQTDPGVRGDTATGGTKPATMEKMM